MCQRCLPLLWNLVHICTCRKERSQAPHINPTVGIVKAASVWFHPGHAPNVFCPTGTFLCKFTSLHSNDCVPPLNVAPSSRVPDALPFHCNLGKNSGKDWLCVLNPGMPGHPILKGWERVSWKGLTLSKQYSGWKKKLLFAFEILGTTTFANLSRFGMRFGKATTVLLTDPLATCFYLDDSLHTETRCRTRHGRSVMGKDHLQGDHSD